MVTRMDRTVGRVTDLLKDLKLDENTLVIFASDNGAIDAYAGTDAKFFGSLGNLRGMKGSLYEGGIRVPLVVRWPGHVKAGRHERPARGLLGPAADPVRGGRDRDARGARRRQRPADAARAAASRPGTSSSTGSSRPTAASRRSRAGKWKAVRQNLTKGPSAWELYDLDGDPSERTNVAAEHPDVVKRLEAIAKEQHTPSALFPLPSVDPRPKKK